MIASDIRRDVTVGNGTAVSADLVDLAIGNKMPQPSDLLPPWQYVAGSTHEGLLKELRDEVAPGHPLYDVKASVVARRQDCDDVLFALEGHASGFAVVHLTWTGKQEPNPAWPFTRLYSDWQVWSDTCMRPDHEEWAG